jgi:hypothetical protein
MSALILIRDSLGLDTRQRNHIENCLDRRPLSPGTLQQATDIANQYRARRRPTVPCNTYNCHGLTFASRRTGISDPAVIQKILTEDNYQQITDRSTLYPGDIALYINPLNNDIEHSGVVVDASPTDPLRLRILSKWGSSYEFIHNIGECPYDASNVVFYRMTQ